MSSRSIVDLTKVLIVGRTQIFLPDSIKWKNQIDKILADNWKNLIDGNIFQNFYTTLQSNCFQESFERSSFKNVENENFDFSLDFTKIAAPSKYNN